MQLGRYVVRINRYFPCCCTLHSQHIMNNRINAISEERKGEKMLIRYHCFIFLFSYFRWGGRWTRNGGKQRMCDRNETRFLSSHRMASCTTLYKLLNYRLKCTTVWNWNWNGEIFAATCLNNVYCMSCSFYT